MKLITLNTWGGRAGKEKLLHFFKQNKNDIDIFCLQEVWSAPYSNLQGSLAGGIKIDHESILTEGKQEISKILSGHNCYFHPHYLDNYGLAIFVNKNITIDSFGDIFVHKYKNYKPNGDIGKHARNIQFISFDVHGVNCTVTNFHGLWNGEGKHDSADRLAQSKNICTFLKTLPGASVLCGDFNVLPETESIKILEKFGLNNLVIENNIKTTRTSFYTKKDKFADYIFVSKNIIVHEFKVLQDEVSDHSPLFIDFDVGY